MINRLSSAPTQEPLPDIVAQQIRTRDRIFRVAGKTIDFGLAVGAFGVETTGYALGKALNALIRGTWAALKGTVDKPYRHAA